MLSPTAPTGPRSVNGRKLVNSYQEQAELKERQRIERAAAAAAVAEVAAARRREAAELGLIHMPH